MNAEVYTCTARFQDAATAILKVINDGGHSLDTNFVRLFSGDNNESPEIIFPIIADALVSQSFGKHHLHCKW